MFTMMVEGLDTLDKDLEDMQPRIDEAITAGLKVVLSDWSQMLPSIVERDVYDKYEPKSYVRTDVMVSPKSMWGTVTKNTLDFRYEFSTEMSSANTGAYYSDSDDVIRAIQDGKRYPWGLTLQPRPFWDTFVSKELIGGEAEKSLVNGMNNHDRDLKATATGEPISIESSDTFGELHGDPQGSILHKN